MDNFSKLSEHVKFCRFFQQRQLHIFAYFLQIKLSATLCITRNKTHLKFKFNVFRWNYAKLNEAIKTPTRLNSSSVFVHAYVCVCAQPSKHMKAPSPP
jgi:hypothetical protein